MLVTLSPKVVAILNTLTPNNYRAFWVVDTKVGVCTLVLTSPVSNFGNSGKTMLKKGLCFASGGDCSYWNQPTWPAVLASEPDIVTIMLGTNDAKEFNWFGVQSQGKRPVFHL